MTDLVQACLFSILVPIQTLSFSSELSQQIAFLLPFLSLFFILHNNTTQAVTGKEKTSGAMNAQAPSKYITLVSGDGFEFVVLRDAAGHT